MEINSMNEQEKTYEISTFGGDDSIKVVVSTDVTEWTCGLNYPSETIALLEMTTNLSYIEPYEFCVQGIQCFRIFDYNTGELLVETDLFKDDGSYDFIAASDSWVEFCEDYNENQAEAIEKLKNNGYEE